jgi:hypothetical protein
VPERIAPFFMPFRHWAIRPFRPPRAADDATSVPQMFSYA